MIGSAIDDDVEAGLARELDELTQAPEARVAGDDAVDTVVSAVVEHAHDAHIAVEVDLELADEALGNSAAAVNGGAAEEAALAGPVVHHGADGDTLGHQRNRSGCVPEREPDAGELVSRFEEEQSRDEQCERGGPAEKRARHLADERG